MGQRTKRLNRPAIEALEDRAVPATFTVANVGELQAAIAQVNNTTGPNTIQLKSGEYTLTSELKIQNAGDLTIQGQNTKNGGVELTDTGGRVLEIDGGQVKLSTLTIARGGEVDRGGGILAVNADVTVANCTVADNVASGAGGGIYAEGGTLNVQNSSISKNGAVGGANTSGGGIASNLAAVNVSHSSVVGNIALGYSTNPQAATSGAGGGFSTIGGALNIANSTVSNNAAYSSSAGPGGIAAGGAIISSGATVAISASTLSGNSVTAVGSPAVNTLRGSVLFAQGGTVTITNSQVSDNHPQLVTPIDHPSASVVLNGSTVNKKKVAGSVTLNNNSDVPQA